MVQHSRGARFQLEAPQAVWISGKGCGQDFYRNVATQAGVPGPVHLAHPACAERREDIVRT
jgi:hypothetical protein